jgi:lipopolysaccharide transport system ATP-binding protein
LLNSENNSVEEVQTGDLVRLKIVVQVSENVSELVLGYMIKDRLAQPIFGTNTYHLDKKLFNLTAGQIFEYEFKFDCNLGEGTYSIAVALHTKDNHLTKNYEWRDLAFVFKVANVKHSKFIGSNWMPPKLKVEQLL